MAESASLNFPPEVIKFVDDAMNNKTKRIPLNPGFPTNPTAYDTSEFFQLRRACAISTVGIVPPQLDPGKVCNLVLVKAVEETKKGAPIDSPNHLLALHRFIMMDKGYAKGADSARSSEDAAVLGAQIYAMQAQNNRTTDSKVAFTVQDPRWLPKGATKPVGFNNFKGMALDAAFTEDMSYFLKESRSSDAAGTAYAGVQGDGGFANSSTACRVDGPQNHHVCRATGYQLSGDLIDVMRKPSKSR